MIMCRFANVGMILFAALFVFCDKQINDLSEKSLIISDSFYNFSGS
tara:strand:+ start:273 stop:410 length:138 start_codon:yes stop_codon:yes gene_type:complete